MTSPIPNIASGSSDQENRRIDDKCLKRKRKPCVDCHNDKDLDAAAKKKKKKRTYMMKVDMGVYQPPPDLPEKYKQMVNGPNAALVIQKQLFTSDVNPDLNRLTLPPKQILCKELLRPNEIEILKPKDALLKVPFIDPELRKEEISLSLWKLSSSNERSLVFKSEWNHIVKKNDLGEGDLIQIWSFRDSNDQLQLALVVVKRAEKRKSGEEVRSTARSSSVSNVSEDSASASHSGRKCLKIRFKCNASRSESTSTCELLSQ
ncbi:B3 domain-containing protein At2g31420-like [Rosa chinensis]|uniref:B3 domain-containing protein At2g31420-like n=1 Tax=Rosa chinensis TaxID=74649 RepID=UPI001AD949E4|nr:B3 domain-containing protein At2g31420-like [Rosa chinensis]